MYHHVIRRRVRGRAGGRVSTIRCRAHIDRRWRERLASGSLFINDQFVTLVRRPARGKAGLAERAAKLWKRKTGGRTSELPEADPKDVRSLRAAAGALIASLGAYGATLLGDYQGNNGHTNTELLELLSALYNGEMRPVRRPADDTDIGRMLPYRRVSFGLDAMELQGRCAARISPRSLSLKDYPDATSPGLLDTLLRLPFEMVRERKLCALANARPRANGWILRCAACARPTRKPWPNGPTCWPRATRWAPARSALAIIT